MYGLMAAIKTLYDEKLVDFFKGGYAHIIGEPAQGKPVLVAAFLGGPETDRCTGSRRLESLRVRLTAVATTDTDAAAGSELVYNAITRNMPRDISSDNTDGYISQIKKVGDTLDQDPERDTDQTEVWYGVQEFEFVVGRSPK